MPEDSKKATAAPDSQKGRLTLETTTPSAGGGEPTRSRAEATVPNFDGITGLSKIYIAVGLVGTLVIVFLSLIYMMIRQATDSIQYGQEISHQQQDASAKQIEGLRQDLKEAQQGRREDLEKMTDRYIATREVAEKRHLETLAAINKMELSNAKTNLFLENLASWFAKESRKPVGSPVGAPPPKPEQP